MAIQGLDTLWHRTQTSRGNFYHQQLKNPNEPKRSLCTNTSFFRRSTLLFLVTVSGVTVCSKKSKAVQTLLDTMQHSRHIVSIVKEPLFNKIVSKKMDLFGIPEHFLKPLRCRTNRKSLTHGIKLVYKNLRADGPSVF